MSITQNDLLLCSRACSFLNHLNEGVLPFLALLQTIDNRVMGGDIPCGFPSFLSAGFEKQLIGPFSPRKIKNRLDRPSGFRHERP